VKGENLVPGKKLDKIVFWEDLKRAIIPCLIFTAFTVVWVAFSFNVPVASQKLFGTVLNTIGPVDYEGPIAVTILIELDGGRVVSAQLPQSPSLPNVGQHVTVVRYIKRFFGDSFGLQQ
jgi:hypothetical protein